ncbi:Uncharacterized protein Rs2_28875 [Raphanus sativus]|nr:Uncharacterized protein Rs2_28875 [Raphanus sativus]
MVDCPTSLFPGFSVFWTRKTSRSMVNSWESLNFSLMRRWKDHCFKGFTRSHMENRSVHVKVCCRLAQRLLFGNTNYGDLRKYLSSFFDTTIGAPLLANNHTN